MAVLTPSSTLHARSEASSRAFSVIFATIAFLIILVCVFWGFILPRLRQTSNRHRSFQSTATQSYQDDYHDEAHYLNHPPVFHSSQGRLSPAVRRYNPRTESPFPPVSLGPFQKTLVPPCSTTNPTTSSHGLFSPSTERFISGGRRRPSNQAHRTQMAGKNDMEMLLVGTETDYILPVPEPLVLKPRPAGRPPPLTRQLERFPMPLDISRRKKAEMHSATCAHASGTNEANPRTDYADCPRTAQKRAQPSGSPTPGTTIRIAGVRHRTNPFPNASQRLDGGFYDPFLVRGSQNNTGRSHSLPVSGAVRVPQQKRRRGLDRAGPVTRPKTPVAEMREGFDKSSSASKTEDVSNKTHQTPSVQVFSRSIGFSTPPTSPLLSVKNEPMLRDSSPCHGIAQYTSPVIWSDGKKISVEMFCSRSDSVAPLQPQSARSQGSWRRKGFVQSHGTRRGLRPARLSLSVLGNLRACKIAIRRHSASSLSTMPRQLISTMKGSNSVQASSIYSRDATGVDFLASPLREGTQVTENVDTKVEPKVICMELVRSKIDNWDLHTGNFAPSDVIPPAFKRVTSMVGSRDLTGMDSTDMVGFGGTGLKHRQRGQTANWNMGTESVAPGAELI